MSGPIGFFWEGEGHKPPLSQWDGFFTYLGAGCPLLTSCPAWLMPFPSHLPSLGSAGCRVGIL